MLNITFGGAPVFDAQEARQALAGLNLPMPAGFELANSLSVPVGQEAARGYLLIQLAYLPNLLDAVSALNFTFYDPLSGITQSITWNGLVVCREPINLTPSLASKLYLVEVADARWLCHNPTYQAGVCAMYNVSSYVSDNASGPTAFLPQSLDSGTVTGAAWTGTGTVTAATDASPIVITSDDHGLSTGDIVSIDDVAGNTAANGIGWTITVIDDDTFSLGSSTGNGAYTSGGNWFASPLIITSAAHGLLSGASVTLSGVGGIAAADGTFTLTAINANTFSIPVEGAGTYTSGGSWTAAWTWASMCANLWAVVSPMLGPFPGLPIAPDGIPEGWMFEGVSAWGAVNQVLARIGCTVRADLTQPLGSQFTVVQVGAPDFAATLALALAAPRLIHDGQFQPINLARVPGGCTVLFRCQEEVSPALLPELPYAVQVAGPDSAGNQNAYHPIWDDMIAVYSGDSLENSAALATRAANRAADFFRGLLQGGNRFWQRFSGLVAVAPGSLLQSATWRNLVGPGGESDIVTDVVRHPAFHEDMPDYTSQGTAQDLVRLGLTGFNPGSYLTAAIVTIAITGGTPQAGPAITLKTPSTGGTITWTQPATNTFNSDLTPVITAGGPTGSSTQVPVITYNKYGQLTLVSTATIYTGYLTAAVTSINANTNAAQYFASGNLIPTWSTGFYAYGSIVLTGSAPYSLYWIVTNPLGTTETPAGGHTDWTAVLGPVPGVALTAVPIYTDVGVVGANSTSGTTVFSLGLYPAALANPGIISGATQVLTGYLEFTNGIAAGPSTIGAINSTGGITGDVNGIAITYGVASQYVQTNPDAHFMTLGAQLPAGFTYPGVPNLNGNGTLATTNTISSYTPNSVLLGFEWVGWQLLGPTTTSPAGGFVLIGNANPYFGVIDSAGYYRAGQYATDPLGTAFSGGVATSVATITIAATSGQILVSNGGSSWSPVTPDWSVGSGGTGKTSFTAYAVICGGATSTGALQNVSGLGTIGYVLTSNGSGALPTWQTPANASPVGTSLTESYFWLGNASNAAEAVETAGLDGGLVDVDITWQSTGTALTRLVAIWGSAVNQSAFGSVSNGDVLTYGSFGWAPAAPAAGYAPTLGHAVSQSTSSSTPASLGPSFTMAAGDVWQAEYVLYTLAPAGTGGIKLQWTGPSSPTQVLAEIFLMGGTIVVTVGAFSTASVALTVVGSYVIKLFIRNGSSAGAVQLQWEAGTSGNSTTLAAVTMNASSGY